MSPPGEKTKKRGWFALYGRKGFGVFSSGFSPFQKGNSETRPRWFERHFFFILAAVWIVALASLEFASAAVPTMTNYQGRLEDTSGNPVTGNTGVNYNFKFSIWDASDTAAGTRLWPASAPASTTFKVTNGVFDARLGDTSQGFSALNLDFNTSSIYFLQVEVYNTSTAAFETLSPRQAIVSAGFAINANTLNGLSQGTSSNNLLLLDANGSINLQTGAVVSSTNVSSTNITISNILALTNLTASRCLRTTTGGVITTAATDCTAGSGSAGGWTSTSTNTGYVYLTTNTDLVGIGATSSLAKLYIQSTNVSTSTLILQGVANQTANLLGIESSSGQFFFTVSPMGLASSTEFRSPSSTIGTLTVANSLFDSNGNKFSTSSDTFLSRGIDSQLLFGMLGGGATSSASLTFASTTGLFTISATTSLASASTTGNVTVGGTLQANAGQFTFANASGTNLFLAGYLTAGTSTLGTTTITGLTYSSASGTNETLAGTFQVVGQTTFSSASGTSIGIANVSTSLLLFTTASGTNLSVSGYLNTPTLVATTASSSNVSSTNFSASSGVIATFVSSNASSSNVSSTNVTVTGYLVNSGKEIVTGPAFAVAGNTSSSILVYLQGSQVASTTLYLQGVVNQTANLFAVASNTNRLFFTINAIGVASSSEFRSPSSTIGTLTAVTSILDFNGNKYSTSSDTFLSRGVDSQVIFGLLGGGATSSLLIQSNGSTTLGIAGTAATSTALVFVQNINATAASTTLLVRGATNQTGNLLEVGSSTGQRFFTIGPTGVASSSEFRSPSSTITTFAFTNASGSTLNLTGSFQVAGAVVDFNGNKFSTSSDTFLSRGVDSQVLFGLLGGGVTSSLQFTYTSSTGAFALAGQAGQSGNIFSITSSTTGTPFLNVLANGSVLIATSSAPASSTLFSIATSSLILNVDAGGVSIGTSSVRAALNLPGGTVASQGINFGDATANLYRSGAGALKTDSNLTVGGAFVSITGNQLIGAGSLAVKGTVTIANSVVNIDNQTTQSYTSGAGQLLLVNNASFAPTSGTGTWSVLEARGTINQTVTASGITRGLYINPTLTSAADFRALEVATSSWTLASSSANNLTWNLIGAPILTMASSTKSVTASTFTIAGAPNTTSTISLGMTISSSTALSIQGLQVSSTTNAYSLYIDSPFGATDNVAIAVSSGTIGFGTVHPSSTLHIKGQANQTNNLLTISSSSGQLFFTVSPTGVVSSTEFRTPSSTIRTLVDFNGNKYVTSTAGGSDTFLSAGVDTQILFGKIGGGATSSLAFTFTSSTNKFLFSGSAFTIASSSAVTPDSVAFIQGTDAPVDTNASSVLSVYGGTGGAYLSVAPGTGGGISLNTGVGGASSNGATNAANGGTFTITSGAGGNHIVAALGGVGGAINITAGNGGTTAGSLGGAGGTITINPGAGGTNAANGNIILGNLRGMVGIGTASPSSTLHIISSSVGTTTLQLTGLTNQTANLFAVASNTNRLFFTIGPTGVASSTEFRSPSSTISTLVDFNGNKYTTSTPSGFSNGTDGQVVFGMLGGGASSSLLIQQNGSSTIGIAGTAATSTALVFVQNINATAASTTLLVRGSTNQTGNLLVIASSTGQTFFSIGPMGVASSTEFRSPSSTIGTFTFTNASGSAMNLTGSLQVAGALVDFNGNKFSTSTGSSFSSGVDTQILFGQIGGGATSSALFTFSTTTLSFTFGTSTAITNNLFTVATTTNIFTILSNGNTGFGTTTPQYQLVVSASSSPSVFSIDTSKTDPTFLLQVQSSSSVNRFTISNGGVASSSEFRSPSSTIGTLTVITGLAISTSSLYGATTTLTVCAQSNCTAPTTASSTNAVAFFASTGGAVTNISIVARGVITSGLADIGEYIDVVGNETDYRAGDVLSVSLHSPKKFEKANKPYDRNLMGVVTETAGLVAGGGEDSHGSIVIALAGRVPIKVNGENGDINVGDYLTASSQEGVAMKAMKAGRVLAIALESYSFSTNISTSTPKVFAFMNPHWESGSFIGGLAISSSSSDTDFAGKILTEFINQSTSTANSTNTSEIFTDRIGAGLEIITPKVVTNGLIVDHISALHSQITFNNDVIFFGRPYFNSDTAGFATIPQGQTSVDVTFTNEYLDEPIVNANISLNAANGAAAVVANDIFSHGVQFLITNKTTKGFTIELNKPAPDDITFNWIALAVKNAKTFQPSSGTVNGSLNSSSGSGTTTPPPSPIDTSNASSTPPTPSTAPSPIDTSHVSSTPPAVSSSSTPPSGDTNPTPLVATSTTPGDTSSISTDTTPSASGTPSPDSSASSTPGS